MKFKVKDVVIMNNHKKYLPGAIIDLTEHEAVRVVKYLEPIIDIPVDKLKAVPSQQNKKLA
jgi:hypothetical protein